MELFKCGHPKTSENSRSNGRNVRCATCKRAANLMQQRDNPEKARLANRKSSQKRRKEAPELERARKSRFMDAHPGIQNEYSERYRRKMGKVAWGSPEMAAKISISARKAWREGRIKPRVNPSKLELSCIPMFADRGYRHTGDGSFWITGKDGQHKNPDFKKTGKKAVIEVWGNWWHRGQVPQDLIDWYADNGYKCEVYWESDIKAHGGVSPSLTTGLGAMRDAR